MGLSSICDLAIINCNFGDIDFLMMNALPVTPARTKRGRPKAGDVGQVEVRVFDTATALFLEQGFGRTTLDQVLKNSKSGKSAFYLRYPNKESLFATVVQRSIAQMFAEMKCESTQPDLESCLRFAGTQLAESMLIPRCVSLMRITAAEAHSFPELAQMAYSQSFQQSVKYLIDSISKTELLSDEEVITEISTRFCELVLQPLSFQAAFGANIENLRSRVAKDIEDAILLLTAKGLLESSK